MPLDLLHRGVHMFLIQGGEINEHMLIHKLLSTDKKMKKYRINYSFHKEELVTSKKIILFLVEHFL